MKHLLFVLTIQLVCASITAQNCTTPPTASCVSPFTIDLDQDTTVAITTAMIDNGSMAACGLAQLTVSPTQVTCANFGSVDVTLVVTDNNGATDNCIVTLAVFDPNGYCCPSALFVYEYGPIIPDGDYNANQSIFSQGEVPASGDVTFRAGTSICLDPGFEVAPTAQFETIMDGCCTGASIISCKKVIESIQPNMTGVVDVNQVCAVLDSGNCVPSILSVSFSNTSPTVTSFLVDCTQAAYPGGIVPGGYTTYLWNTASNTVVGSCNNFLQVLDGAGHCQ